MEIELLPTVSLAPETFSVLVSPVELMAGAINIHGIAALQNPLHLRELLLHSQLLFVDGKQMMTSWPRPSSRPPGEATVLLYAPALDPHLQKLTELADRVFCIYGEPAGSCAKAEARVPEAQRTLGAYS